MVALSSRAFGATVKKSKTFRFEVDDQTSTDGLARQQATASRLTLGS